MRPDSMLVEARHLDGAMREVLEAGPGKGMKALRETEPVLAAFLGDKLVGVAGKLTLAGAPAGAVRGAHAEMLLVVLGTLAALRLGYRELWQDLEPPAPANEDEIPF